MSFVEMFKDLEKYISDPKRRWKYCMRSKRGLTDTSQKGGFFKDKAYLKGAYEILTNRSTIDFRELYSGKISLKDLFAIKSAEGKADIKLNIE